MYCVGSREYERMYAERKGSNVSLRRYESYIPKSTGYMKNKSINCCSYENIKDFSPNIAISIVASVCFSGVFYISKFLCGNGEVYEESST